MGSVVSIARRLRAQREHNGQWRAVCPVCNHYDLSLATGEVQDLIVQCRGGCDFDDIYRALLDYGLLDDDDLLRFHYLRLDLLLFVGFQITRFLGFFPHALNRIHNVALLR